MLDNTITSKQHKMPTLEGNFVVNPDLYSEFSIKIKSKLNNRTDEEIMELYQSMVLFSNLIWQSWK